MVLFGILKERKTIVYILNLVKTPSFILFVGLVFFFNNSYAQPVNLKESFFPLIPGSYWVMQDTFFSKDAEQSAIEGTGINSKETKTDSVLAVMKYKNGYKVQMLSRIGIKQKSEVKFEYFLDTNLFVYEPKIKNDSVTLGLPIWKLFPNHNDTVYELARSNRILIFDSAKNDSTILLFPKWKSKNEQASYLFKKGVGLVGQIYPSCANRLIEYRIGNGPVIKKHWHMETPQAK